MSAGLYTLPGVCDNCGVSFLTDGYQWTCNDCRHPQHPCICGSDDVTLEWEITTDPNGDLIPEPVWRVECAVCERRTIFFETAKEAHTAWMNNEIFTPIGNTGHFEEIW